VFIALPAALVLEETLHAEVSSKGETAQNPGEVKKILLQNAVSQWLAT
jgi:hypothetical protein